MKKTISTLTLCIATLVCVHACYSQSTTQGSGTSAPPAESQPHQEGEEAVEPSELVARAIIRFHDQICSDDEAVRVAALENFLPKKKHVVRLFGEADGNKLWELLEPQLDHMKANSEAFKAELSRDGELDTVRPIDLRARGEGLEAIPENIPVFRAHNVYVNGNSAGSSYYLVIDEEAIFYRDLPITPEILARMLAAPEE